VGIKLFGGAGGELEIEEGEGEGDLAAQLAEAEVRAPVTVTVTHRAGGLANCGGWVGLGWVGLGWVGLGWVGLVGWLVGARTYAPIHAAKLATFGFTQICVGVFFEYVYPAWT
jgi:hypothetical protein